MRNEWGGGCSCNLKKSTSPASTAPHSPAALCPRKSNGTLEPSTLSSRNLATLSFTIISGTGMSNISAKQTALKPGGHFACWYPLHPTETHSRDFMSPSLGLVLEMLTGMSPKQRLQSSQTGYRLSFTLLSVSPGYLFFFNKMAFSKATLCLYHTSMPSNCHCIRSPFTRAQWTGSDFSKSHS